MDRHRQPTLFPVSPARQSGSRRHLDEEPIVFETEAVSLSLDESIWDRVFTVAPLVLVGTRERGSRYNLAPKHMAMPLGWGAYFAFVCTPRHATYANVERYREFTVSFPHRFQVVQAGLAADRREADGSKPSLAALPTFPASTVDGVFVHGCYLFLECELDRIVDGFDDASLVVGRIVAAAAREEAVRAPDRDDADVLRTLPPLAYLNPGRFAPVGDSYSFPFPAGFQR
ncbi:MAG TPA: flavin reductase [Gaiellaceae bacterium]|nr:flavin reductase [Gaiellaceae bacterium]